MIDRDAETQRAWYETFLVVEPMRRVGEPERPRRAFPIDMLRYASCLPLDETDSRAIDDSLTDDGEPSRAIALRRFSTDGEVSMADDGIQEHSRTGVKRWQAFGWDVVCHVATRAEAEDFRDASRRPR